MNVVTNTFRWTCTRCGNVIASVPAQFRRWEMITLSHPPPCACITDTDRLDTSSPEDTDSRTPRSSQKSKD